MKKQLLSFVLVMIILGLCSCTKAETEPQQDYLEVIGEAEMITPEAGYKLNLTYNGPMEMRNSFVTWADSIQQKLPGMIKTSENIYLNHIPEQTSRRINKSMYQTSVTYLLNVEDSTLFASITQDLLNRNIPFNLNVMGTFMKPEQKARLQQNLMKQALVNAKTKLDFLNTAERAYSITQVEELDNTVPYGPEYYDYNRKMIARVKVKARLHD